MTEYQERMDALDLKILGDVAKHGWSDMSIFPVKGHEGLPFNYTVGFSILEHPEILILGLDHIQMHGILGGVYEKVKEGQKFRPDVYFTEVLSGYRTAFVEIPDPVDNDYPMTMTRRLLGDFKALQMVWPDEQDRFPWHEDFDPRLRNQQVLLGPWRGED